MTDNQPKVGSVAKVASPPSELSAKRSSAEEEAWAGALAHQVRAEMRRLGAGAELASNNPQNHHAEVSDERLTQGRRGVDAPGARAFPTAKIPAGVQDSSEPLRLHGKLEAGRLGVVRYTVERGPEGLKVVIGIEDRTERNLAGVERGLLLQSLKSAGLNVKTLTITSPEAAGTAFAQQRSGTNKHHGNHSTQVYREQRPKAQGRRGREIEIVG